MMMNSYDYINKARKMAAIELQQKILHFTGEMLKLASKSTCHLNDVAREVVITREFANLLNAAINIEVASVSMMRRIEDVEMLLANHGFSTNDAAPPDVIKMIDSLKHGVKRYRMIVNIERR